MELNDIQKLMQAFNEAGLNRLQYTSGSVSLMLEKGAAGAAAPVSHPPVQAQSAPAQTAAAAERPAAPLPVAPAAPAPEGDHLVKAPMVGVLYIAPSPEAAPFVQPGQRVVKGQTLCILEAMKVMNEIQAEWDGVVEALLAQPEEIVEYGQPLFSIRRGA